MLGEIDQVLARVEALPAKVAELQAQMAESTAQMTASAAVLDAAGERYRATTRAYTEQVKVEIRAYLERKTGDAGAELLEGPRKELQAVAAALAGHVNHARRPFWERCADILGVAVLSSGITAGLVWWLLR